MPADTSITLVNLGNLSKPANTLIEKISNAAGVLFKPRQIKGVAKAKAEAARIEAQSDIEITDLHRRAARRWIEEEAQRQKNMEDITAKALPQLDENAKPDSIEDDWIVNFFDKSRIVSDNEMQELWSRVLAGEANAPGTYSKRTVNILSDLDKADATLFTKFCGFVWMLGGLTPVVFHDSGEIYNRHGINFVTLQHLDSVGLIQFDGMMSMSARIPRKFAVAYYGRQMTLEMPKDADNDLDFGVATLTRIGKELAPICGSRRVEGFWEYVLDHWKEYLPKAVTQKRPSSGSGTTNTPSK